MLIHKYISFLWMLLQLNLVISKKLNFNLLLINRIAVSSVIIVEGLF